MDSEKLEAAREAILDDLRDRKLLKYLFADDPSSRGAYGYVDTPIDLETQHRIVSACVEIVSAALTPPADGGEPFGYWVEQKHADPVLLRKPAYIPEPSQLRTVTPLFAASPSRPSPVAGQREAIAAIIARAYGGSLNPGLGVPGDFPVCEIDYRAADAILALLTPPRPT
jgi:hypothetical protein